MAKGDPDRVRIWVAATRMFADAPVAGHGFQLYKVLHDRKGEPELTTSHNERLRFFAEEGVLVGLDRRWLGVVGSSPTCCAGFNDPFTYWWGSWGTRTGVHRRSAPREK